KFCIAIAALHAKFPGQPHSFNLQADARIGVIRYVAAPLLWARRDEPDRAAAGTALLWICLTCGADGSISFPARSPLWRRQAAPAIHPYRGSAARAWSCQRQQPAPTPACVGAAALGSPGLNCRGTPGCAATCSAATV